MKHMIHYYQYLTQGFMRIGMPIFMLFVRLWIAKIFWFSGLVKITDWQATLSLFAQEYQVPLLPPEMAAYLATAAELACPILLTLGIATRFATLPLLMMTAIIQITYPGFIEHTYWAILLMLILLYGPGALSFDNLINSRFNLNQSKP